MAVARTATGLARDFARGSCPEDAQADLENCLFQADTIRVQTLHITAHKNPEVGFLADFFEVNDEFDHFSDLMKFWSHAEECFDDDDEQQSRLQNPRAFRMLAAAKSFAHSFDSLPPHVQTAANLALSLHKYLIINHIMDKSAEFVRDGYDM